MHMIARSGRAVRVVGRSDSRGFWLYGNIDTPLVRQAVTCALTALQADARDLAYHPRCGTGPAVGLITIGAGGMLASHLPTRSIWQRRLATAAASLIALLLSRPLADWVQRNWVTDADLERCTIQAIREVRPPAARGAKPLLRVHRVHLRHEVT